MNYKVRYANEEMTIDKRTPRMAAQEFKDLLKDKVTFNNSDEIIVSNTMGDTFKVAISKLN